MHDYSFLFKIGEILMEPVLNNYFSFRPIPSLGDTINDDLGNELGTVTLIDFEHKTVHVSIIPSIQ